MKRKSLIKSVAKASPVASTTMMIEEAVYSDAVLDHGVCAEGETAAVAAVEAMTVGGEGTMATAITRNAEGFGVLKDVFQFLRLYIVYLR